MSALGAGAAARSQGAAAGPSAPTGPRPNGVAVANRAATPQPNRDNPADADRREAEPRPLGNEDEAPREAAEAEGGAIPPHRPVAPLPPILLGPNVVPIDLNTALRLAGVQNPELLLARQRVVEGVALRQLAAAQFLPSANGGFNYDTHTGVLQQSNGNILSVNRSAVYVGAGANAVAAGTVSIPGVVLSGNVSEAIFGYLVSRQVVREREFTAAAVRNDVFLRVTLAYSELLRAEGRYAIAQQNREEAARIARLTADYAAIGEGRQADANRAASELAEREAALRRAEGDVVTASARLASLLNLDPSIRLHPTDQWVVPHPIVPDPIPLGELIAIAMLQHPALAERRTVIREALLALEGAKLLPFSPTLLIGFSAGGLGGGSNLVRPVFGGFGGRTDFDAIAYWSLRNLGVGNAALINLGKAQVQLSRFQELEVLNRIRAEVAAAYAQTHARFAQIASTEQAVRSGISAFVEDYERVRARAREEQERRVLPIELLNSFRLLARARDNYLDAIVDYNEAHFSLYVALGQPPANVLARPVPTEGIEPSEPRLRLSLKQKTHPT
ncbi:MAG: TolC family protein, partial [Isosphaeraceae bacterium]|nr:TolC family protein [Isosphaeraceae bacterium]